MTNAEIINAILDILQIIPSKEYYKDDIPIPLTFADSPSLSAEISERGNSVELAFELPTDVPQEKKDTLERYLTYFDRKFLYPHRLERENEKISLTQQFTEVEDVSSLRRRITYTYKSVERLYKIVQALKIDRKHEICDIIEEELGDCLSSKHESSQKTSYILTGGASILITEGNAFYNIECLKVLPSALEIYSSPKLEEILRVVNSVNARENFHSTVAFFDTQSSTLVFKTSIYKDNNSAELRRALHAFLTAKKEIADIIIKE